MILLSINLLLDRTRRADETIARCINKYLEAQKRTHDQAWTQDYWIVVPQHDASISLIELVNRNQCQRNCEQKFQPLLKILKENKQFIIGVKCYVIRATLYQLSPRLSLVCTLHWCKARPLVWFDKPIEPKVSSSEADVLNPVLRRCLAWFSFVCFIWAQQQAAALKQNK